MKPITGEPARSSGFALLGLIVLLTGGAVSATLWFAEYGVRQAYQRRQTEEATLARIAQAFVRSVAARLRIPDASDWAEAVAGVSGMNRATVESGSSSPGGAGIRRVMWIDGGGAAGLLPYTQPDFGLRLPHHPLLGARARVMIVSCSRPSLDLPFPGGVVNGDFFENLWNWSFSFATPALPPGWPASWTGHGQYLHVARIPLSSLFAPIGLKNVRYGAESGWSPHGRVRALRRTLKNRTGYFLKGSLLRVSLPSGRPYILLVVREPARFELPSDGPGETASAGGHDHGGDGGNDHAGKHDHDGDGVDDHAGKHDHDGDGVDDHDGHDCDDGHDEWDDDDWEGDGSDEDEDEDEDGPVGHHWDHHDHDGRGGHRWDRDDHD